MYFSYIAQSFKKIEDHSSRNEITKVLAQLIDKATAGEARIISYLALGTLRAIYKGTQFNFAEKSLVKVVANVLGLTEQTVKEHVKKQGDLGSVIAEGTWEPEKELTLKQVYDQLVVFENISGEGSQEEKTQFLQNFILQIDPLSARYIVRMVIGKLRLGFSDMTIVDALSWSVAGDKSLRKTIEHAYNISADIGHITYELKDGGIEVIEKMSVILGVPIRPAAAERLPTAAAIIKKIGTCVAQAKLDGFRLQVHLDKRTQEPKVWFFSRNLLDMSQMFPEIVEAVKEFDVESLIVEGEALAYDEHTDSYLPFQETVKRRRKHDVAEMAVDMPLKLVLFDILYLDGKPVLEKTQKQRQAILQKICESLKTNVITTVDEKECSTAQELETYFVDNIAAGLEGLVIKKPNAPYQPGKRNFNWIKLKRQEEGHLDDTLDAVVLGYYNGKGRRAKFGIGAFLVGLYNKEYDRFETVAKIGTGLTDSGWIELKAMCDRAKITDKPSNVVCHKVLAPDVWVAPELIVIIRADEITKSPVHAAGKNSKEVGFALRFPRFMGYRIDKSAGEATTVKELKDLFKHQKEG